MEAVRMPRLKNKKQEAFCHEFMIDRNRTKAAERAGYSKKCSNRKGSELYRRDDINKRIEELTAEYEKRVKLSADKIIEELENIFTARASDFAEIEKVNYENGEEKSYERVNILPTNEVDLAKLGAVESIKQGANGIEVKVCNKLKAAELLMRHKGMLNDKLNVGGKVIHEVDEDGLKEMLRLAGYKPE
jgi:phage terminase small subunit